MRPYNCDCADEDICLNCAQCWHTRNREACRVCDEENEDG